MFLPAPFDLVEFDDAATADAVRSERLLLHVNGLVTEPAQQVLLGWVSPARAQVTTATRRYTGGFSLVETGRSDAISLAGNPAPDGIDETLLPLQKWTRLQSTAGADDSRWYRSEAPVDDRPEQTELIDTAGGSFGWLSHDDLIIAFALRRLPGQDLRLRTVSATSATRYPCNPLTPRTWQDYIAANRIESSQFHP